MDKAERIKNYGEVFTPVSLVNEMLDKLPQELFKDPTKTWLDPSVGEGVFLFEILKRLEANGISKDHAVTNQLYGVDIQEKNCRYCVEHGLKNIVLHDALTYDYSFKKEDLYEV